MATLSCGTRWLGQRVMREAQYPVRAIVFHDPKSRLYTAPNSALTWPSSSTAAGPIPNASRTTVAKRSKSATGPPSAAVRWVHRRSLAFFCRLIAREHADAALRLDCERQK